MGMQGLKCAGLVSLGLLLVQLQNAEAQSPFGTGWAATDAACGDEANAMLTTAVQTSCCEGENCAPPL